MSGGTTADDLLNEDEEKGMCFAVTLALPVNRHHAVNFHSITGDNAPRGHDFEAAGIARQYRWGGGL